MSIQVYILLCKDGTYYTGITKNFERRLKEHNSGRASYTKKRLPVIKVFGHEMENYKRARSLEVRIKSVGAAKFLKRARFGTTHFDFLVTDSSLFQKVYPFVSIAPT